MIKNALDGFPLPTDLTFYISAAAIFAVEIGIWLTLPTPLLLIFFVAVLALQAKLVWRCRNGAFFRAGPAALSVLCITLTLAHFHQGVLSSHELMRHYLSHGVIHSNNPHAFGVPDLWDTNETSVHIGLGRRFLISLKMSVFFLAGLAAAFAWLRVSQRPLTPR
ncbi:hypothetical protein [Gluconobacter kanchanaburiensis]|uniref:Uncharacterized protein n=1 Tax=Gluconobacter kanchanaburiensis NBRC 103587 TaxID=1307948 RepID=A0A511B5R4_9PROT|nr:hypothetical protein [Gluconobacter kanchanaburiensis]MBF0861423.1 hypothetical protein [Gluconobacter kanchanaburiensis]GBR68264.1 hypothetical protein AA103587_0716 [Gluconobacter kanchanaburiensis NBRC 103587]GEK95785.1 hypothetical protein GKA01_09820 [Gluconobacter kanchanaburiensis NBRC 103587]